MNSEQEELKPQYPSKEQLRDYFKENNWPIFSDITYDHLTRQGEREVLATAVSLCREYAVDVSSPGERIPSMIMLASGMDGDIERTGFGCGKTTLAKIIFFASGNIMTAGDGWFGVTPPGRFYESRKLMALFDDDREGVGYMLTNLTRLLVIDDVGREGTLKWEKRDPELQIEEKQDRYYTVINKCYEKKIGVLITSNLSSRELAAFLGGASWSRLLQMTPQKYRINMTGLPDMRPVLSESEWFCSDDPAALRGNEER